MKVIFEKAGLKGNYTNHSGKRTCSTAFFQKGVDEQEIMGRTGHRSEIGVLAYKRGNADIECTISKALDPPEPKYTKKEPKDDSGHREDISNKLNVPENLKALGPVGGSSTHLTTALSFYAKFHFTNFMPYIFYKSILDSRGSYCHYSFMENLELVFIINLIFNIYSYQVAKASRSADNAAQG